MDRFESLMEKMTSIIAKFLFRLFLLLVLLPVSKLWGQQADSLISSLSDNIAAQDKADTLNQLGFDLIFTDPTQARRLFDEVIRISTEVQYQRGLALALKNKGISYDVQGNSNQAIVSYQASLTILEKLQDTLGISRIKNNLGIAYKNLNDLERARKFYAESMELKQQLGDIKGVAYALNNIGEIYQKQAYYEEALEYFTKANTILESIGDERGQSITLFNIALSYVQVEDWETAIQYVERSMAIDEATEDYYSLSLSYITLADAYSNTGRLDEGLKAIDKAAQIARDLGALKVYYDSQVLKAQLLRKTNRITSLPDLYEEILLLNDSLSKLNMIEETARMKAIYESREQELIIEDLEQESELNQQLIETQNQLFKMSLLTVILLVILLVVVYWLYRKVGSKKRELEQKIIERDIAKEEAELASQVKSQFLAQMSHEIRTPLNAVIGYTDQILETNLDEDQRKHLSIVNQSAIGLLDIINRILDLSKLEAGKLELSIQPTDLVELCEHVIQMAGYTAQDKNLEVKLTPIDEEHRYVMADDTRLRQVLVNLLSNAVKFTEEGQIELKVEVLGEEAGRTVFRFSVKDTGIGIKSENLEKIFHAFSQEDSSTTRKYGGTGLGLSISNTLLSLMDSRLQVESEPGRGSTFFFEVPFGLSGKQPEKTAGSKTANAAKKPGIKVVSNSDQLKVLIAEDNANNMLLTKMMLKKALPNSTVLEAENGMDAVKLFSEQSPDVVLMDVQMPEMDGYDASKQIRQIETTGRVPIIAISAGSMKAEMGQCREAGMDDFVSKPIINNALSNSLAKWIKE